MSDNTVQWNIQTRADMVGVETAAKGLTLLESSGRKAAQATQSVTQASQQAAQGLDKVDKSSRSAGGGMEAFGQRSMAAFTTLGSIVGVVSGVRQAMSGVIDVMGQAGRMNDLSTMTGEGIGNLVVMQRMLENSGRSGADIAPLFARIAKAVDDAGRKSSPAAQAFQVLGINVQNFARLSPAEKVEALQQAVSGLEDPLQRAQVAIKLFGTAGTELLPLLTSTDGFARARKEVGSLGEQMEASAERLAKGGDDVKQLGLRYQAAMVQVAEWALPTLNRVTEVMEKVPTGALAAGLAAVSLAAGGAAVAFGYMQVQSLVKSSLEWITTLARIRLGLQSEESAVRSLIRTYHQLALSKQAAGRASAGGVAGVGRGLAGVAGVGLAAAAAVPAIVEYGSQMNALDKLRSEADQALLRMVDSLGKSGSYASSEDSRQQALGMIATQLADIQRQQADRPGWLDQTAHFFGFGVEGLEYSGDALEEAAQKLKDAAAKIEKMTPEQIRQNALTGAEKEWETHQAATAERLQELAKLREKLTAGTNFALADDALVADFETAEDPAERRRLLRERARLLSRTVGDGEATSPEELVEEMQAKVTALQRNLTRADASTTDEQMQAWAKQLEGLRDYLAAARQLQAAYRAEEAAEARTAAEENFRAREWQLEQEERALIKAREAGMVSEADYLRRRKELLRDQEDAKALGAGKPFDQIAYERGLAKLDDEAEARRKSAEGTAGSWRDKLDSAQRGTAGDRLAQIGGFLGSSVMAPLNYARRTADAVEKMLNEQKATNQLLRTTSTGSFEGGLA